jgi:hypothetical protein
MKQQEVFKKIGSIIKELNEQYEYLESTPDQLNDLELELFVANAHFLADHAEVLRKLNLQNAPNAAAPPPSPEKPKQEKPKEEKFFEPVVQQAKPATETKPSAKENTISETPQPAKPAKFEVNEAEDTPVPEIDLGVQGTEDEFSVMMEEPEIIKHELVLDESQNWEDEDDTGFDIEPAGTKEVHLPPPPPPKTFKAEPVKEEPQPEPERPKKEEKHEKEEEPLTIHQKMSAQLHATAAGKTVEQSHAQPIADLKQGITLNDKLLYIKDLFNGYNLAYSEAIDIMNRFTSFEEADKFLKSNYAVKNHWDDKQATADKFYALLKRRYEKS